MPTAIRIQRGNPGGRPLNKREPKPRAGIPKCPAWLSEKARQHWKEIVPELRAMNVLTLADGDVLAAYCQIWARWRLAEEYLNEHGDVATIYDGRGQIVQTKESPHISIARNLLQLLNRYQQELGLTPSARTRIRVEKPSPEASEFERFLARKSG